MILIELDNQNNLVVILQREDNKRMIRLGEGICCSWKQVNSTCKENAIDHGFWLKSIGKEE